jgi:hypothetical protein
LSVWELADVVMIGCRASDACMSSRPSMIRDSMATERQSLLIVSRYGVFSGNYGIEGSSLLQVIPRRAH